MLRDALFTFISWKPSALSVAESTTVLCESPSIFFSVFLHCLDTLKKTFYLSFLFICSVLLGNLMLALHGCLGGAVHFSLPGFGVKMTSFSGTIPFIPLKKCRPLYAKRYIYWGFIHFWGRTLILKIYNVKPIYIYFLSLVPSSSLSFHPSRSSENIRLGFLCL